MADAREERKTSGEGGASDGASRARSRGGRSGGGAGGDEGRNRDRGRGRKGDKGKGAEESADRGLVETLIDIYRCSATVKGGRRLSFGALVTVGDGKGRVGIGYGKAKEVPGAIQKAIKKGQDAMIPFKIAEGDTVPHQVKGRFGASKVILVPARPGTGVIAGAAVKAILEAGGLHNVLTKSVGNNNTRNIVKATLDALAQLRSKEQVAALRGVEL